MTLLVFMGSGETAPAMVKVHREVFASCAGPAVMLDTPFGFQENADDLIAKTLLYFAQSVGATVEVAAWRRADAPVVERERSLAQLSQASWVFAGPGSPTYALTQWRDSAVPAALLEVARRGGTLVFGSAAAVTAGTHAIPVYEIYKVGEEPHWEQGLDLLAALTGLRAAVVPHFDNAEGRNYDTRFCFLGETRLAMLEALLPSEVGVLGVDEHTAAIIDVDARTLTVAGIGTVTVRRRGASTVFASGDVVSLDEVDELLRGIAVGTVSRPVASASVESVDVARDVPRDVPRESLRVEADAGQERFDVALAARDVDGCVAAILAIEESIQEWSADTLASDDANHARRVLRACIVRLGQLAEGGARDPRTLVDPFVSLAIELRARAREGRDFATSDFVRDRLAQAGVEVRDTASGVEWDLREE